MSKRLEAVTMLECELCGKPYGLAIPRMVTSKWGEYTSPIKQGFCDKCQKEIDKNYVLAIEIDEAKTKVLESGKKKYHETGRHLYWNKKVTEVFIRTSEVEKINKTGGMLINTEGFEHFLKIFKHISKQLKED